MHGVLRVLNEYSNLLLVMVTVVYVLVNWRMLVALKKSSFREREARHLDDLKEYVCTPIIGWLDNEVMTKLRGRSPFLVDSFEKQAPKVKVSIGDDPFERSMEIRGSLGGPDVPALALYSDAKDSHFSAELGRLEKLRGDLRTFAIDCAAFGRRCADDIASNTNLKRENLMTSNQEGADSDALIVDCISSLMQGAKIPWVRFQIPAPDALEARASSGSRVLARGKADAVRRWLEDSANVVKQRWEGEGFPGRLTDLKCEVDEVRQKLGRLMFTHSLQGDCVFIGRHK